MCLAPSHHTEQQLLLEPHTHGGMESVCISGRSDMRHCCMTQGRQWHEDDARSEAQGSKNCAPDDESGPTRFFADCAQLSVRSRSTLTLSPTAITPAGCELMDGGVRSQAKYDRVLLDAVRSRTHRGFNVPT